MSFRNLHLVRFSRNCKYFWMMENLSKQIKNLSESMGNFPSHWKTLLASFTFNEILSLCSQNRKNFKFSQNLFRYSDNFYYLSYYNICSVFGKLVQGFVIMHWETILVIRKLCTLLISFLSRWETFQAHEKNFLD